MAHPPRAAGAGAAVGRAALASCRVRQRPRVGRQRQRLRQLVGLALERGAPRLVALGGRGGSEQAQAADHVRFHVALAEPLQRLARGRDRALGRRQAEVRLGERQPRHRGAVAVAQRLGVGDLALDVLHRGQLAPQEARARQGCAHVVQQRLHAGALARRQRALQVLLGGGQLPLGEVAHAQQVQAVAGALEPVDAQRQVGAALHELEARL
ncbi:MAG: hypothetical protein GX560_10485 [Deinococcales bacterium]|nr:hypothetical protein [Deinococcales bacterium]